MLRTVATRARRPGRARRQGSRGPVPATWSRTGRVRMEPSRPGGSGRVPRGPATPGVRARRRPTDDREHDFADATPAALRPPHADVRLDLARVAFQVVGVDREPV